MKKAEALKKGLRFYPSTRGGAVLFLSGVLIWIALTYVGLLCSMLGALVFMQLLFWIGWIISLCFIKASYLLESETPRKPRRRVKQRQAV